MQSLVLILIILLFLTGFLGGGFGIREFKLPKASAGTRLVAILTSLLLGVSGFVFQQPSKAKFSLTNNLTRGALRERVVVTIEGQEVGSLTSTSSIPKSKREFTVPKAGVYTYSVELFGFYNNNGQETPFYGKGAGTINVESEDTFELQGDLRNNQLTLTLVEK